MSGKRKLKKSSTDRTICGVCGGFAEYFGINSFWIRLIWAIIALYYGAGIALYLICAFIMPEE